MSILQSTVPDYPLVSTDFCPLHCLSFNLRFLITLWYLHTFVHCIVYPSIYGSWLPFGIYRLLSIALSILQSTVPDYPLVSTDFCPLHCLSFNLRFLITLWYLQTFVHCIVYPSIYGSWLPFGIYRLLSIALSILQSTVPDYLLVSTDFCPLHCLSFNLRFLITLWYLQTFIIVRWILATVLKFLPCISMPHTDSLKIQFLYLIKLSFSAVNIYSVMVSFVFKVTTKLINIVFWCAKNWFMFFLFINVYFVKLLEY